MKLGAVLIAAGLGKVPMEPAGTVCVAQRMIASLQKAGVRIIAVVTGPEEKKLEKQLAQSGVVFLYNAMPEEESRSIQLGLSFLSDKCSRIFLMKANHPVIAPETLLRMEAVEAGAVVPVFCGKQGELLLVKPQAKILSVSEGAAGAAALVVEDPGILLTVQECTQALLADHDRKLTRPEMSFAITRGKNLVDGKLMALLSLIRESQSVREACSRMQISYSTAWNMLNAAEDALGYPLLLRNKGGPSGAGSLLTEKGEMLLLAYTQFEAAARDALENLYETYFPCVV